MKALDQARAPRLEALTGLRFFAAVLVVVHHYTFAWQYPVLPMATSGLLALIEQPVVAFVRAGHMGVSLFFVLSGFILTYTYISAAGALRGRARDFWRARAARIYPLYLTAFAFAGVFIVRDLVTFPDPICTIGGGLLLLQAWCPLSATVWNPPGWSLSAEAFFYLLFPMVVPALLNRVRTARSLWVVGALCWILGMLPVTLFWLFGQGDAILQGVAYWSPLGRLPEFILGVVACRLWQAGARVPPAAVVGGLVAIWFATLVLPDVFLRGGTLAPLFALMVIGLADGRGRLGAFCAAPAVVLLGEASYALYVLHWPLIQAITDLTPWVIQSGAAGLALTLVLGIGLSLLSWRYLETPARRLIRGQQTVRRVPLRHRLVRGIRQLSAH